MLHILPIILLNEVASYTFDTHSLLFFVFKPRIEFLGSNLSFFVNYYFFLNSKYNVAESYQKIEGKIPFQTFKLVDFFLVFQINKYSYFSFLLSATSAISVDTHTRIYWYLSMFHRTNLQL